MIAATTEGGFPGALRILGAVAFGAVAVLALSAASLRLDVPFAQSGGEAVGLVEDVAESVTFGLEDVPHAISLRFAFSFGEFTVEAILLANTIDPDAHLAGSALSDELIGCEGRIFGGELVVTVLQARSSGDGAVPHAPGVGVACGSGGVLVGALFTARTGAGVPFALVPSFAVGGVAEAADATAVALDGIPFASGTSVAICGGSNHVASAHAHGTVDGVGLVPIAFNIESTGSGVFGGGVGADVVAVVALLLASVVACPFAHSAASLLAN